VIILAIVEVAIIPIGTGSTSISNYVADCHKLLRAEKRVKYELTSMGTAIEGDLDVVLDVIRKMHESPFANGAMRVSTMIKIDDRRDKNASMVQKINAVNEMIAK
jgi:uncharacterized protein (TIGR00106 family)